MWTTIFIILAIILVVALILAFMRGVGKQIMAYEESLEFQSHEPKVYKYKTLFDAKLIELGVKEKWDANFEAQEKDWPLDPLEETNCFMDFIVRSFEWEKTTEGEEFWSEISKM